MYSPYRLSLAWVVVIAGIISVFSSCYLIKGYRIRHFQLTDYQKLPSVTVGKSDAPSLFADARATAEGAQLKSYFDTALQRTHTAAFLIVRNDSLLYEGYFNGFNEASLLPSFSVVKSYIGLLALMAIEEGKIQPGEAITTYLPEWKKKGAGFEKITVQHLLDMRSGIRFNEGDYGLKDDAVKLGLRRNNYKQAQKFLPARDPGTFDYRSIDTQLLSYILEKAYGKKIQHLLEEKLWKPLGTEYDAVWNTDNRGQVIAYGTLNATARDFARLGSFMLHHGAIQGKQRLAAKEVESLFSRDTMRRYDGYRNQWWSANSSLNTAGITALQAQGILGQYVYVNPHNRTVVVRLGRYWYHPARSVSAFVRAAADGVLR